MPEQQTAVFGGGCFWCLEAVFARATGVKSVESGYMGGRRENPTYEQVCTGASGHVYTVAPTFDATCAKGGSLSADSACTCTSGKQAAPIDSW